MWRKSNLPFIKNYRPLVMAHRGDSANIPENTLPAYQDAAKLGVDVVETDLRFTKDDELVLFHDPSVKRTTNGDKRVIEYTLAELKQLDAGYQFKGTKESPFPFRGKGYHICGVEEMVKALPNVRFSMDIKNTGKEKPDAPKIVAEKLETYGIQNRVLVGSFHQDQINAFRTYSDIPTSAGPKETWNFWRMAKKWIKSNRQALKEFNPDTSISTLSQETIFGHELAFKFLTIPEGVAFLKIVTPDFMKFAHFLGIAVYVWTVNDPADMKRLLSWGVDGLYTDTPKTMLSVLGDMNF